MTANSWVIPAFQCHPEQDKASLWSPLTASTALVQEYQLLLKFLIIFGFLNIVSLTAAAEDHSWLFQAAGESWG